MTLLFLLIGVLSFQKSTASGSTPVQPVNLNVLEDITHIQKTLQNNPKDDQLEKLYAILENKATEIDNFEELMHKLIKGKGII